jgi:hypothetical protein
MSRRDSHQQDGLVGDQTLHPAGKLRESTRSAVLILLSRRDVHADGLSLITSPRAISPSAGCQVSQDLALARSEDR